MFIRLSLKIQIQVGLPPVIEKNTEVNALLRPYHAFKADVKLSCPESVSLKLKINLSEPPRNLYASCCELVLQGWIQVIYSTFPIDVDDVSFFSVLTKFPPGHSDWHGRVEKGVYFEVTIYYVEDMRQHYSRNKSDAWLTWIHEYISIPHLIDIIICVKKFYIKHAWFVLWAAVRSCSVTMHCLVNFESFIFKFESHNLNF